MVGGGGVEWNFSVQPRPKLNNTTLCTGAVELVLILFTHPFCICRLVTCAAANINHFMYYFLQANNALGWFL